ncbi:hypothetical protein RJ639_046362 [Escallonia herrerae]|uniref:UBA domain-containing protein n=1 Tax=Escallonia herrerae TaxID=1293975 RepID=A0AA88W8M2_9ASTE|nr:hypothetical protein RJ639_046362 [Escallonia herrerae]
MAVPEVNTEMLRELQDMGFPLAPATRALHYSGNSSLEAAINWIIEHENDPDIDQMPLVSVQIEIGTSTSSSITEQVMLKAQELRDRARRRKEEEENKVEREREKDRTRAGKQLLEAKRVEEENERKRSATDIKSPLYTSSEAFGYSSFLALRKVEKEEERRARDKIRQKLEMDKLERRSRLKLHPEDLSSSRPATSVKPEKEDSIPVNSPMVPVNFGRKPELMRDCLRSLKRKHKEDDAKVRKAFHTLLIYVKNVARNPDEEKFRKIRLSNPAFQDRVGAFEEGTEFLELCGFERVGDKFLYLPKDKVDMEVFSLSTPSRTFFTRASFSSSFNSLTLARAKPGIKAFPANPLGACGTILFLVSTGNNIVETFSSSISSAMLLVFHIFAATTSKVVQFCSFPSPRPAFFRFAMRWGDK